MIFTYAMRRNAVRIDGDRSSSLNLARGRLVLISAFFMLAYMMLAARAFDLTIIQGALSHGDSGAQFSQGQQVEPEKTPVVSRADVVDRNGVLVATTLQTASLYADPLFISDPQAAAQGLVEIFPDLSFGDVLQKLQSARRFVWIKRGILPHEQFEVLKIGEPGLGFQNEDSRVYPHGALLSHLVGYTNIDNEGQAGVERSFNKYLGYGEPLTLTVDIRLQHALRREMEVAIKEFSAAGGVGVIMDVTNGEILAGVSLPDFDPHAPGDAKNDQIFNRMTLGVYELGSVFKIFSTAALFETLNVPMSATFDTREPLKRGRFTINDFHGEKRILTVPEVFMYSSNIGSAMMGEAVGTEALRNFYRDLGLLDSLDFEIREVTAPLVPSPWRDINTLTAAYGHGVATTPLQMTAAVSSIMNGGYVVKPRLVIDRAGSRPGSREEARIVSAETAHRMRQLMRLVVTDGTGGNADVAGYRVGGKTGTAEKPSGSRKGYDRKRLISSFIGVFPMDAPRYAIFVAIDEPQGTKATWGYATGGWVAAPVVKRVVTSMASILAIPPVEVEPAKEMGSSLKQYISVKNDKR